MTYFMGVDGGGSNLRIVITNDKLQTKIRYKTTTANPNTIGHNKAKEHIQQAIKHTLKQAKLTQNEITSVGIGIAGAAAEHSEQWLYNTIADILPESHIIPSSDYEIALIGAVGKAYGVLILAGTGSIAYGVNEQGKTHRVGGWGYLIGDEGSGYAIGINALQQITYATDRRKPNESRITQKVLEKINLQNPKDIITWLYSERPRTHEIAQLAQIVIQLAQQGEPTAIQIINRAAKELSIMTNTVIKVLGINNPEIAFAGGLLREPNNLSLSLCKLLNIKTFPTPKYPPEIGAALLAKTRYEQSC